jgi:microcystin-dependent protein
MSEPFIGEIRMFAGNFAPAGWAFCEGQEVPISENDALFTLIGTTYGGDGQETFNLPDLRARVPMHTGSGAQGEEAGVESVTLTVQQIPSHTHPLIASSDQGSLPDPGNHVLARSSTPGVFLYQGNEAPDVTLHANSVSPAGGSQPHQNLQPYLCVNFIIALFGIFPSPT